MNHCAARLLLAYCLCLSLPALAQVLNVQVGTPPPPPTTLVNNTDTWQYRRGTNEPQADWRVASTAALDGTWLSGPGGLGYGDAAIQGESTTISGMRNVHTTLYVRREFTLAENVDPTAELRLFIDYDDGFVAYLDGVEIARRNVNGAAGTPVAYNATAAASREASCCNAPVNPASTISLGAVGSRLSAGTHVLSFIALNDDIGSSDLHLIPRLIVAPFQSGGAVNNGAYALTTTNSVVLSGTNTLAGSVRVTVDGDDASLNAASGTWSKAQTLQPGWNRLYIAVHDVAGNILSNLTQDIIYETERAALGGTLASSMLFSNRGTVLYITSNVAVPANTTLQIAGGTVVLADPGRSIAAQNGGRLEVRGTFDENVFFHINGATNLTWGPLTATGTNSSIDAQFADVSHAQVSAVNGAVGLVQDVRLHDFDPGAVGTLGRAILMCNFAQFFRASRVHVWNYYECLVRNGVIEIEDCVFENMTGDALDFDAAQPGSFTRRCTYRNGTRGNVDAVDIGPADLPGSFDTLIADCIMFNFPFDKGVSVGDGGSSRGTIVSNSLIIACNAGVMAKDLCDVSVRNCTIVNNASGFTNYNKVNPASPTGGGITTNSYNNILWNNVTTIGMANNGQLYADHNDFGGTNWPGAGNIDVDPLFVNAAAFNFRLRPESPVRGAGRNGADMGVTYPIGGIPLQPLRLAVLSNGTNAPVLTWVDDSLNEDGVGVQRSTNAVHWETVATLAAETTNHVDATAAVGQKYYYRVQHTNYVGVSPFSNPASGLRQAPIIFVGGTIASSTTWSAGMTVIATSTVTVAAGATLTIEPCVRVQFNQGVSLVVNGLLLAEGTPDCRIVFTRNTGATSWGTVDLFGASSTHRLSYVDLEFSSGNIDATGTAIALRSVWWTNTTSQLLDMVNTSVDLRDSYIPGGFGNEPIHFSNMPANGYALIQGNVFGAPQGYNDSVDFTGGNRPGPIVQFIDNVFLAAVDDCFDMDGTDAHIEGNIFMNVHQDASRSSTANAVAAGADGGNTSELVVVRNIFYDCDHALLLKDFGSAIFENNTVVTIRTNAVAASRAAYVQFGEPHRNVPGGRGILMNGNLFWDLQSDTPFLAFTNGPMFMVANDNIIQGTNMMFGGNSTNDPMFVNWQSGITHENIRSNLALLPSSPALGTGPNGLDRGALVPGGASVSGEPNAATPHRTATLTVAGPGIYAYRWKLNDGPWSAEVPLTNNFLITATMFSNAAPIVLTNLTNGTYTVAVVGKNSAGAWQSFEDATLSKTWSVTDSADSDFDGMPDDWELANGLNKDVNDAALDADGDGMSNLSEYRAGTNPQDAASRLWLAVGVEGGAVQMQFTAQSNRSYTVQFRTAVDAGNWTTLTNIPAAPSLRTIVLTNESSDAMQFYRAVTP